MDPLVDKSFSKTIQRVCSDGGSLRLDTEPVNLHNGSTVSNFSSQLYTKSNSNLLTRFWHILMELTTKFTAHVWA